MFEVARRWRGVKAAVLLIGMAGMGLVAEAQQAGSDASAGTETPVVFVHGNGDDSAKWIGVMWLWETNGYPKDRLYAIRFTNPSARTDDTKEEAFRSSTIDATAELSAFVTRVLIETHSKKVALVGSSRGGMTIRNYLEHGGAGNVSYAVLCGTPNHGVMALDANLNGEFNGKGPYLRALNHASAGGMEASSEVVDGVKMMTLRSDRLDKYAQPTGIGLGQPKMSTGVSFEGPALKGAENVVLTGFDHRELAFQPGAFAEMYRFITGQAPKTLVVAKEDRPVVSGLVTGFGGGAATNVGLAGVHLRVVEVDAKGAEIGEPVSSIETGLDGKWGPVSLQAGKEYEFDLEHDGRHVRFYKAPIVRSTGLMNLRFLPAPRDAAGLPAGQYVFVARPQGYFSRDRDPVEINGAVSKDEPGGLPLVDSFVAAVPGDAVTVRLRGEKVALRASGDLGKDLPVADFLW